MIASRHEIPTPALLIDLDALEWNIDRMARHLAERGRAFRPHAKTHKCPAIARRLVAAGAVGACVAKLSEGEVFAAHGVRGLLITTAVIGAAKIGRAIALAREAPDTIFVADHAASVRDLNAAAAAAGLTLNVAVDVFFGRTGIAPGQPAADLARVITQQSNLRFAGLQAYDGTAAHVVGFEQRRARTRSTMSQAVETRRSIEAMGIECPRVTSGSTGTFLFDSELDGITEIQPGSFLFMDLDYESIGGPDSATYREFKRSLTVIATVVSRQSTTAIVDAGYKSFSTDRPITPLPVNQTDVTYEWAGDEHGRLHLGPGAGRIDIGERIEFIPPHCDPTVNLYDQYYVLRGDRVVDIWAISARGMSQ